MTNLLLDAEALYGELREGVSRLMTPRTVLVGIWSGGAWLAERLTADLKLERPFGTISSTLHRDDFGERGLGGVEGKTDLPFEIDGARVLLIDDVLYTGRTIRAVLNELFDYGRPASVDLAVLVDRGGRELPIQPAFAAARLVLPSVQRASLARAHDGRFTFAIVNPQDDDRRRPSPEGMPPPGAAGSSQEEAL
jgi:pyrimidine operon attenuation protein/uracil phosphoribosyltransferase